NTRKDQGTCDQKPKVDVLAEKNDGAKKTDQRLQINVNGDGRRADASQCPCIQNIWRSGGTDRNVKNKERRNSGDRNNVGSRHRYPAEWDANDGGKNKDPHHRSKSAISADRF